MTSEMVGELNASPARSGKKAMPINRLIATAGRKPTIVSAHIGQTIRIAGIATAMTMISSGRPIRQ